MSFGMSARRYVTQTETLSSGEPMWDVQMSFGMSARRYVTQTETMSLGEPVGIRR